MSRSSWALEEMKRCLKLVTFLRHEDMVVLVQYLKFMQSLPNLNCGWRIYVGIEENLFHKNICSFKEVINVTEVYHWMVVYH